MSDDWTGDGTAVPSGRWTRAARMGGLGASVLGAAAGSGARKLLTGRRPEMRDLFLTPGNAKRLADELSKMRGAAMKMGQLLSMETADVLPPEIGQVLARLRSDAHVMPPAQLKSVLQAEYGRDFQKRFKRFDPRPVAAASIGQVHRAVSLDGQPLALKVQYPGVRAAIDADVANLGMMLRAARVLPRGVAIGPLLDEARHQLHEEADYHREADELDHFGALIDDSGLTLPGVQRAYCTSSILAMDYIESAPIETLETADQDTRDAVISRLFALTLREVFDWQRVQTDPNFANFRWQPDTRRVVLLDYGASRPLPEAFSVALRGLLRHALDGDQPAILSQLQDMDILPADASDGQLAILRGMVALALETFSQPQIDFADPRFLTAMRNAGTQLGLREDFRHIPPWDVLYLQRKIGGLVLLATRLKARVAMRDLSAPYANGSSG